MRRYLTLIQLNQLQHQNARYLGYRSKKIAKSASWSNENIFAQFYDRLIQGDFSNYSVK